MFKLFSGSAHEDLTKEVAKLLKIRLAKSEVLRFGNSEVKVTIQEKVKDSTCVVVQPTSNPTDTRIMELLFYCDALKREEAKDIIGVIPYFGYAKQNIQHRRGEDVSANVVIRLLETLGFHKIFAFDLHDEGTAADFNIPFENLTAFPLLAKSLKKELKGCGTTPGKIAIVSPDQGGIERARNFGEKFFGSPKFDEVVIEKERDQNIPHKAKPVAFYGDVKNKVAIIVDDMVVSGSTLIPAIDLCLKHGAIKVYAAIIHHDFITGSAQKIQQSPIEKFFTTNTIALQPNQNFPKLIEINVAPLIAQALKSI